MHFKAGTPKVLLPGMFFENIQLFLKVPCSGYLANAIHFRMKERCIESPECIKAHTIPDH